MPGKVLVVSPLSHVGTCIQLRHMAGALDPDCVFRTVFSGHNCCLADRGGRGVQGFPPNHKPSAQVPTWGHFEGLGRASSFQPGPPGYPTPSCCSGGAKLGMEHLAVVRPRGLGTFLQMCPTQTASGSVPST